MNIGDLPLTTVEHLHEEVLLPVWRLFQQLAEARHLASATRESIHAESLNIQQRERFLFSAVERQILPRYRSLLDAYRQHQEDFQSLFPHDSIAVQRELQSALSSPSVGLFDDDPSAVSSFGRDVARVSEQISSRLRELSYG